MEVSRMRSIVETRQRLAVPLDHFTVADPFEHELVGEDALVVNFEPILVELQLSRAVISARRCNLLLCGSCALRLSVGAG